MPEYWSHLPDWDTAEWAAILSATFTAAAATAAWLSARASLTLIRSGRTAHVSAGVTRTGRGHLGLTFANAGPVLAAQVQYFIVSGDWKHGGTVSDGHLAVGEKWARDLPRIADKSEQSYLVWIWRDLDDNVYIRSHNWETKRFTRGQYVRRTRKEGTNLGAAFREMYPKVPIPDQ